MGARARRGRDAARRAGRAGAPLLACLGLGGIAGALTLAHAHSGGSTGYASIVISRRSVRYGVTLTPGALPGAVAEELRLAHSGNQRSTEMLLAILREKIRLGNISSPVAYNRP